MGIGEAAAYELAAEGCDLAICARNSEPLNKVRDRVVAQGVRCTAVRCDIRNPGEIAALTKEVKRTFGRLDILVNNAGAATPGTFATLTDEQLVTDYELKIMGQIRCTRAALPLLEKSPAPRVINVNAIAGRVYIPGLFATTVHRAGCYALNKALAWELAEKKILVNSINIGLVHTNQIERMHAQRAADVPFEKFMERAAQAVPLKRLGEPHEVSGLIAFLASDRAAFITGASIDVGGGQGAHV
jgi:NAD(P)-dependent dehydrogenase (short-subunit alcohol dehydrogenase family)